jgi:ferredoxin
MSIRFKDISKSPTDKVFDTGMCEPNLNLLAHAQCIELNIGSQCGGHGVCGKDRVQIPLSDLAQFSPPSPEEKEHLSSAELAKGVRLACQCYPEKTDLDLDILFFY